MRTGGVVLPFVGLLVAAVAVRVNRPAPAEPPPRPTAVVVEASPAVPEPLPEPAPAPAPSRPVYVEPVLSASELLPLVEARFSDETILAVARVTGRPFRPSSDERETLRRAGMSDALLGRLSGEPPAPPAAPPAVVVVPPSPVAVYAPVTVTTVVEAPPAPEPEPYVSTVILTCAHGRAGCCPPPVLERPAIYGKPPFFKTREFMPTKPLPTEEEVARREAARSSRIRR